MDQQLGQGSKAEHLELIDQHHLDSHFLAMQAEYEAMIQSVGIKEGQSVLDAGCGNGSFLPILARLVGPKGNISALDLSTDNVARAKRLLIDAKLTPTVEVQQGSVTALPYEKNRFDVLWLANVSQYLTKEELKACLAECYRVLRPGGLLAIKEFDLSLQQFYPFDLLAQWRLFTALSKSSVQIQGVLRVRGLPLKLKELGFQMVSQHTVLAERTAPLRLVETSFIESALHFMATKAKTLDLPMSDVAAWQALEGAEGKRKLSQDPNFYWREGHVLVCAHVPVS